MKTMLLERNDYKIFSTMQGMLMALSFLIVMNFATGAGAVDIDHTVIMDGQTGCEAVKGAWIDAATTCRLTEDINVVPPPPPFGFFFGPAIEIKGTDITLDGAGKTLSFSGPFSDRGILLSADATGVTVTNITVKGFYYGIHLQGAFGNKITGNNVNGNIGVQIYLESASDNEVSYNAVENSERYSNVTGIWVTDGNKNRFFNNTISYNGYGFYLSFSLTPVLGDANEIYNNNFIGNTTQAQVVDDIQKEFSKPLPIGGNYWDDYNEVAEGCVDSDSNGICDGPYVFAGGQDNYPWTLEKGWEIRNSTAALDIKPGSCNNPVNVKSKGVLPAVILGTKDFNVEIIDVDSLKLEGVIPIRSAIFDILTNGETGDCNELGGDGYPDLVLKFKTEDIAAAIEAALDPEEVNDGDEVTLTLEGNYIFDNQPTPFTAEDTILIKDKGKHNVKGMKKYIKKLKFKK